jgi:hypothetical protein
MAIEFEQANTRISDWANARLPELQASIAGQGIKHVKRSPNKKASAKSLKKTVRKRGGLIGAIGYSIPRNMVFVEKGVGRGTNISQVGNTKRKAKPWYNPVINKSIEDLADIVAEELGGAIVNNLFIR